MVGHTRDESYEVLRVCLCVFCEQLGLAEREVFRISIPVFVACDKGVCNLSW